MAPQTLSPADRIRELSAINAEVAAMLQSAGHAINALTNTPAESETTDGDVDTAIASDDDKSVLDQKKEAFVQHTEAYYTQLQSIVARLRRQAYALEESEIISPEPFALTSSSQQKQSAPTTGTNRGPGAAAPLPESGHITNGGLGNLDVGWLNSRGSKVGDEKEAELMEQAKKLLDSNLASNETAG